MGITLEILTWVRAIAARPGERVAFTCGVTVGNGPHIEFGKTGTVVFNHLCSEGCIRIKLDDEKLGYVTIPYVQEYPSPIAFIS